MFLSNNKTPLRTDNRFATASLLVGLLLNYDISNKSIALRTTCSADIFFFAPAKTLFNEQHQHNVVVLFCSSIEFGLNVVLLGDTITRVLVFHNKAKGIRL